MSYCYDIYERTHQSRNPLEMCTDPMSSSCSDLWILIKCNTSFIATQLYRKLENRVSVIRFFYFIFLHNDKQIEIKKNPSSTVLTTVAY